MLLAVSLKDQNSSAILSVCLRQAPDFTQKRVQRFCCWKALTRGP